MLLCTMLLFNAVAHAVGCGFAVLEACWLWCAPGSGQACKASLLSPICLLFASFAAVRGSRACQLPLAQAVSKEKWRICFVCADHLCTWLLLCALPAEPECSRPSMLSMTAGHASAYLLKL